MAEIFKTFDEFKTAAGGAINNSVRLESLEQTIFLSARKYLVPWLGLEFYEELNAAIQAGNPSAKQTLLFPYLRRALAYLTLYEYQPIASVQLSDSGLTRSENEHHKTAYKYQESAYQDKVRDLGFDSLEYLLNYLYTKKADFSTWTSSDEFNRYKGVFLNNSTEFQKAYSKQVSRYTYEIVRPLIEDVETFAIESSFPVAFFEAFQTKYQADTLSAQEKILLGYIRKAVASFTISEALRRNLVQLDGNSVVQAKQMDTYKEKDSPTLDKVDASMNFENIWGNRQMSKLKSFMEANIDDFQLAFDVESGGTNTDDDAWTTVEDETDTASIAVTGDACDFKAAETDAYKTKVFRL